MKEDNLEKILPEYGRAGQEIIQILSTNKNDKKE